MYAEFNREDKSFYFTGECPKGMKAHVFRPGANMLPASILTETGKSLYKVHTSVFSVRCKQVLKYAIYLLAAASVVVGVMAFIHPILPAVFLIGLIVKLGAKSLIAKVIVYGAVPLLALVAKGSGLGTQVVEEVINGPVPPAAVDGADGDGDGDGDAAAVVAVVADGDGHGHGHGHDADEVVL